MALLCLCVLLSPNPEGDGGDIHSGDSRGVRDPRPELAPLLRSAAVAWSHVETPQPRPCLCHSQQGDRGQKGSSVL